MKDLLSMVNVLAKYDERIIIVTRSDTVSLISPQDQSKPFVWFDINTEPFFSVYKLEGLCPDEGKDEDMIMFEVNSSYIQSALAELKKNALNVEIKLQKSGFPFFLINTKVQSSEGEKESSHQVPVIVVPKHQWIDFTPPYDSIPFDFQAKCPRLPIFKRFIETFKYSDVIRMVLRKTDRQITIEAFNESMKHTTVFSNIQSDDYGNSCEEDTVSVTVEQKSIALWLHRIPFQCHTQCLVQNNKTLKLFYRLGDTVIASFVKGSEYDENVEMSDDEEE